MAKPVISVTSTTWCNDTHHSLFDYESSSKSQETFDVASASTCVRERETQAVRAVPCGQDLRKVERLCLVKPAATGGFTVEPVEGHRAHRAWLVARDLPEQERRLTEGDVVRLGRFEFVVQQLAADAGATLRVPDMSEEAPAVVQCVPCDEAPSKQCRICLMEGEEDPEADRLIAPCSCKGSIEHMHLGCLRHWLATKVGATDASSFRYSPPQCDLCKSCLPAKVGDANGLQPLVTLPQPQAPFIVLEGRAKGEKALHVVSLAQSKTASLGRSNQCDVSIPDVSLSRTHAKIHFENGEFVLEDNKSKFGTLLALKQRRHVEPGHGISIQSGRTLLSLEVQQA